ncbi:MAG: tetratricopeptide repeat protein, partial [Planctomycetota bacterium]
MLSAGCCLCLILVLLAWLVRVSNDTTVGIDSISVCMAQRRFNDVERLASGWLKHHPDDIEVTLLLGEALQRQGRLDEALRVYAKIPHDAGKNGLAATLARASILLTRGRLSEAEHALQSVTPLSDVNSHVDGLWVTLHSLSGRRWESMPALHRTLPTVGDRLMKLIYLANPDEMPAPPEDVFARMFAVRDPLGTLGCARVAASLGRSEQALSLVGECLAKRSDLIEA